jgi:uncharacterized protein
MSVFKNSEGSVRVAWSIALFFGVLSILTIPIIVLSVEYQVEISLLWQAIIILIVSIICQKIVGHRFAELTGKLNLYFVQTFLTGGILGAILMLLPAILLYAGGWVDWHAEPVRVELLTASLVIFSGAVAEELLFRGFLFQRILQGWGIWPAQVIMSLLFLLTHLGNPGMTGMTKVMALVNIFIASLIFGVAYIRTRSLGMSIGLHFMANLTQGVILGFHVSGEDDVSLFSPVFNSPDSWITGGSFGLEASFFGLVTVIALGLLLGTCDYFRTYDLK